MGKKNNKKKAATVNANDPNSLKVSQLLSNGS